MIVLSLVLVIAAAVSLIIGLFVDQESLRFIFTAIALCVVSLLLLWLGTRSRRGAAREAETGTPVYGRGPTARPAAEAGGARGVATDDEAAVVRRATARDRAAERATSGTLSAEEVDERTRPGRAASPVVAAGTRTSDTAEGGPQDEAEPTTTVEEKAATAAAEALDQAAPAAATPRKKSAAKKAAKRSTAKKTAKKSATKKAAAKKATAKKATAKKGAAKKATAKKATAKKAAKKATAKKAAKKSTTKKATATTGAAAREVLAGISGVGAAKQDTLLSEFGSLEGIRAANEEDIAALKGFGPALAKRVKDAV